MGKLKDYNSDIAAVLFGKTRRAVLGLLFCHAEESFYLTEVVRAVASGQGAVQRELERLSRAGIIERRRRGHQVYYSANRNCPIFEEIKSMMIKTAGLADVIRNALEPVGDDIDLAFIYGSMAEGQGDSSSDVDIMIVGKVGFGRIVSLLQEAQQKLNRETNPRVYTRDEFFNKLEAGNSFLKEVMNSPKIYLIGNENELGTVAKQRMA